MKKIMYVLLLTTLVSCCKKVDCPPGSRFECGKGCVANTLIDTLKQEVKPRVEQLIREKLNQKNKPIPSYTKFKVSDVVCVWGKQTGVIVEISWGRVPDGHDPVLVYTVEFEDSSYSNEEYYDTQLTSGSCR